MFAAQDPICLGKTESISVGEINKGETDMKATTKMTALKRALALAAVLALTGTAWAKSSPPGVSGDLSTDRTSATVTVTAQCDSTTQGISGALSVYILQSVGRLINIGIGNGTVTCNVGATPTTQDVTVNAIPGLAFQPGPATMVIRITTIDPLTLQPTVSETGSRVNLHP
jgi:hypothetical protein